ncbi:MAG TPA: hypothetical protein VF669_18710 [Tepidisphaeraceae bacterium]|jgi:hypothetical protein
MEAQPPVDAKVRQRLQKALAVVDVHGMVGSRLVDDAQRLFNRVQSFLALDLIPQDADSEAMEVACYALQLPMRDSKLLPTGKLGRTNLRDRVEQSAEILISTLSRDIEDELLERVTRLLLQLPQRSPAQPEARLLADALNLDDFGISGFVLRAIQLGLQGAGMTQVMESTEKRDEYGYWEARLKDGFHFEPVRQIARRRLERARQVHKLLREELDGDSP